MSDLRLYRVMRNLEGKHCGNEYLGNLVVCGECKHFRDTRNDELERTPNSDGWCKRISRWGDVKCVRANDFCSYGEREGE